MEKNENEYLALCAWKKKYIEAILDVLKPSGNVLEVGFGQGDAAALIQTYRPKHHLIIEKNPELAKQAKKWAKQQDNIEVLEGDFEETSKYLTTIFDTLFYNDFPLVSSQEMIKRQPVSEAGKVASEASQLLLLLQKELSHLPIKYSDEEIDGFYRTIGKDHIEELPVFFENLKKYGYITPIQYAEAIKKYKIPGQRKEKTKEADKVSSDPDTAKILQFIETCLNHHTHQGSRIASYLTTSASLYEDPGFFDKVITNPNLDYQEKQVSIDIPNCPYKGATVMLVTRLA